HGRIAPANELRDEGVVLLDDELAVARALREDRDARRPPGHLQPLARAERVGEPAQRQLGLRVVDLAAPARLERVVEGDVDHERAVLERRAVAARLAAGRGIDAYVEVELELADEPGRGE